MKRSEHFKAFPEKKVQKDINDLKVFIDGFDFASLREVKEIEKDEIFYRASEQAVQQLFDFFCHRFLKSPDEKLRDVYKKIDRWSIDKKPFVIELGQLLLEFRNKFVSAENKFFETHREELSEFESLVANSTWVMRFHFMIEKFVDKLNVKGDYFDFVKNIQNLGEKIFNWIAKNSPEDIDQYKVLSSSEVSGRPVLDITEEESDIIKKRLF